MKVEKHNASRKRANWQTELRLEKQRQQARAKVVAEHERINRLYESRLTIYSARRITGVSSVMRGGSPPTTAMDSEPVGGGMLGKWPREMSEKEATEIEKLLQDESERALNGNVRPLTIPIDD